jgi:hypothetical protein
MPLNSRHAGASNALTDAGVAGNACVSLARGNEGAVSQGDISRDPLRAQHQNGQGRAVQVDPIKPKLKPPITKRLKVECDILISTSTFKFKLRSYNKEKRSTRMSSSMSDQEKAEAALAGGVIQNKLARR